MDYDVVIVGGGPAGAASALTLRQATALKVAVIDAGGRSGRRIGETIPPPARPVLQQLGVWDAFESDGHLESLGTSSCWGEQEPGYNDLFTSRFGHGWHVDRACFDAMMLRQAESCGEVFRSTKFTGAEQIPGDWSLALHSGTQPRRVTARCVVEASGRRAAFATAAGAVQRYLNGSEGALAEFAGRVAAGFETYLETREAYYRIESRWPNHDFWRRRQPQIQLHPLRMLRTGNTASIRKYATGMPEDDLNLLSRLCGTPLRAHGLVSAFRANSRRSYSDRRIILTVQALVESGILQVCEDEDSPAAVPD